jgi:small subunit ribosomal protein S4
VSHAHFYVNGHPVDVPSFLVKSGDKISVRDNSRGLNYWKALSAEKDGVGIPEWLSADRSELAVTVQSLPTREQINLPVKEQLVVEYYSR